MGNEIFEEIKRKYKKSNKYMLYVSYEDIGTLLNLIEKQTKEIEELKKPKYVINFETNEITKLTNDFVSKDKIKAKIEEYDDKEMTVNLVNRSAGKTFQQAVRNEVRKVLQSLLEKEGE